MPTMQTPLGGTAGLSIEDIYNMMMMKIEPDLTLDILPFLDEIYVNETLEEHEQRMDRYAAALRIVEERIGEAFHTWESEILRSKKELIAANSAQSRLDENDAIQSLEQSLNDA